MHKSHVDFSKAKTLPISQFHDTDNEPQKMDPKQGVLLVHLNRLWYLNVDANMSLSLKSTRLLLSLKSKPFGAVQGATSLFSHIFISM